jgi:flagellar secretion chaperone FliS
MSVAVARKYRATQIESASPGQILLALYDGCLRLCRSAQLHIEEGDVAAKGIAIGRACAILGELRSTLDHKASPELCDQLDRLYLFFQEQLSLANIRMDARAIAPVVKIMGELRTAWGQAVGDVEGAAA